MSSNLSNVMSGGGVSMSMMNTGNMSMAAPSQLIQQQQQQQQMLRGQM